MRHHHTYNYLPTRIMTWDGGTLIEGVARLVHAQFDNFKTGFAFGQHDFLENDFEITYP